MTLLDVVDRIADRQVRPFVAPLPHARAVRVFTLQEDIPYTFLLQRPNPGWWHIEPTSPHTASLGEAAQPHERIGYLEALPRFYAIALHPLDESTWLVVPYNASDAAQRGWENGQPRPVYLVDEDITAFDALVTRDLAGLLLFDSADDRLNDYEIGNILRRRITEDIDTYARGTNRDWRNAYNITIHRLREARREQEEAARREALAELHATAEGKMRYHLEFMGAKLLAWSEASRGYRVEWEAPDGSIYNMSLRPDLQVDSAGLCLAGTDRQHNLSSIVYVMEEARRRGRI